MPRTRQQRRAHGRRPVKARRRGNRVFAASMVVLIALGVVGIYLARAYRPPVTRGAIAGEHWHASYKVFVCGRRMTNYPTVEGEIHSHGDGFLHIHPSTQAFTGPNANLGTFLALYQTQLGQTQNGKRFIAFPDQTRFEDGDKCPDGKKYNLELLNNGEEIDGDPASFIPHEDDEIVIRFGKEGKKTFPNPYAKVAGIPDPGLGRDVPANDTGQPVQPPVQQQPPAAPPPEGSPEPSP